MEAERSRCFHRGRFRVAVLETSVLLHVGDARLGRGGGLLLAGPFPRSGERSGACLEISADVPSGVPEDVVSTVTENAKTLNFEQHGFEEE
jgi:hypothetical protein